MPLQVGLGTHRHSVCFWDHCNPHGASQGRETPASCWLNGRAKVRELNFEPSLEVNASSQPFTASPALIYPASFSAQLCSFFPPWCQCLYFQSPDSSVSMLCSIPCSPLPLPLFSPHPLSHLDRVLDWPSHTLLSWVALCQARAARPGLTLRVSDPSMPLGRAS